MRDPLRIVASGFERSPPLLLLAGGIFISALQFVTFYAAALHEAVLFIPGGVGFLNNYGLLSNLFANAFLPYLARLYYADIRSFVDSEAIKNPTVVNEGIAELERMVLLDGRFLMALYGAVFIGLVFWTENTSIHLFGNAEIHWGHKVFDSVNHSMEFALNRLNNLYSWMLVLPLCWHVMLFSTIQLVRMVSQSAKQNAIAYDLLNPDGSGGFICIERAQAILNIGCTRYL